MRRAILWFRSDLRLHDHEPLWQSCQSEAELIPLYCLDPRHWQTTTWGFPKTGSFRSQFLIESLQDLRTALQQRGSDLLIRRGTPETVIPALASELGCCRIYFHAEAAVEERAIESALETNDLTLIPFWGHTLLHLDDLPFSVDRLPQVFTSFRKQVESETFPRTPLATPAQIPPLPPGLETGELPGWAELSLDPPAKDARSLFSWRGGEQAGLARLQEYVWDLDRLRFYKETRNGMLNPQDSSRLSPWLAMGTLSPRRIWAEVQRYEQERIRNDSTYWLIFELLWRDYFRFITLQQGKKLFRASGLQGFSFPWKQDWQQFDRWRHGETGFPLVDACMQELAATGWMSNRGRQNVASFLTKNLGLHWHLGAEWFESLLIDDDVCSNWGNWNYAAGVGNDARGFRYFNIPKQSREYDPQGDYLRHWLPVLSPLPSDRIHTPERLTQAEQQRWGVKIGQDYPLPMVDLEQSAQANEQSYRKRKPQSGRR